MPVQDFVKVRNLNKKYPSAKNPILNQVSFSVKKGNICSIIGRSGAGKSTLLRCLNSIESIDSGQIQIGEDYLNKNDEKSRQRILKQVGTVFQNFNLLSRKTVLENIMLPAKWEGYGVDIAYERAIILAEKVGLVDKLMMYPSQLSGGQKQRVAIARSLITQAKLLLCDEFTSALDPETSLEILALLRQLNHDLGVTILLVTHDMTVVREVSDQVIVMEQGSIVEEGNIEDILLHPKHPVTHSLVRGLFTKQLPNDILNRMQSMLETGEILIQMVFSGESARLPVIADLIRKFGIPVNILAGSLDHLKETSLGVLTIALPNNPMNLATAMAHFQNHQVSAEVLGYLPEVTGC